MQIRLAQTEDFEQLVLLLRQLNTDDPVATELQHTVSREILDSANLELIVAEENGVLAGSCYLNILSNMTRGARPYAVVENVITDSRLGKRGIGRRLMAFNLDRACKQEREPD